MSVLRRFRWQGIQLLSVVVAVLVAMRIGGNWQHVATTALIYAIAAVGLALVVAHTGRVSVGHAAFLAIGAYVSGILTRDHGWPIPLGLAAAVVAGTVAGFVIGPLALRTKGLAFVMVTLAAGELVRVYATQARDTTGGDTGLYSVPPTTTPASTALAAALLAAVLIVGTWLVSTTFGRGVQAARQDEMKAEALGFDVRWARIVFFVASAAIVALAGGLLAHHTTFVSPSLASWSVSGHVLVMVLIGGGRSLTGAVVGAVALTYLEEVVTSRTDRWEMVIGALFIAVVLLGIVGGQPRRTARRSIRWRPA